VVNAQPPCDSTFFLTSSFGPAKTYVGLDGRQYAPFLSHEFLLHLFLVTMEPVGLAASIITLISAASLASATITRAYGLRGCPESVLTSLNEVEDFKGVLLVAQQALGDLDYDNEYVNRLLARARTRIEAFDTFLKEKVLRDEIRPTNDATIRLRKRAKWREITGELQVEIDTLKQELSSIKQSLNVALTTAHL
jgi:hypothetical protein